MIKLRSAQSLILLFLLLCCPDLQGAARKNNSDRSYRRSTPASQAREALDEGRLSEALLAYRKLIDRKDDPALRCEYAFVLARLGVGDAALAQLDQASKSKRFPGSGAWFRARILRAAGVEAASEELGRDLDAPDWLAKKDLQNFPRSLKNSDLNAIFVNANRLAAQDQPHLAAAEFSAALQERPKDPLGWIGFSMALEKLGARESARKALDRAAPLVEKVPALKKLHAQRKVQLADSAEEAPKGRRSRRKKQADSTVKKQSRTILFGGGSFGNNGLGSMTGRVGYFITPTLDAAIDLNVSGLGQSSSSATQSQLGLGVSTRYYWPVGDKAGAAVLGFRLGYQPSPADQASITVSPGYTSPFGDLFIDVSVNKNGFQIGLTVGATSYLGAGK